MIPGPDELLDVDDMSGEVPLEEITFLLKDMSVSNTYFNQGVNPEEDKFFMEVKSFGLH